MPAGLTFPSPSAMCIFISTKRNKTRPVFGRRDFITVHDYVANPLSPGSASLLERVPVRGALAAAPAILALQTPPSAPLVAIPGISTYIPLVIPF